MTRSRVFCVDVSLVELIRAYWYETIVDDRIIDFIVDLPALSATCTRLDLERFVAHRFLGFSYREIAILEGFSPDEVTEQRFRQSILRVRNNLKRYQES